MKRILGLDLGVGSIGWALVNYEENDYERTSIEAIGSRIIPLTDNEVQGLTQGNKETLCAQRTANRGARRNLDRYQQRRRLLAMLLERYGLTFGKDLLDLPPLDLWALRDKAVRCEKLTPAQLGRVLYHLNQRRGYKHGKNDKENGDSAYLSKIKERATEAAEENLTPGQYFYRKLLESKQMSANGKIYCTYRIKEKVFPRRAYEDEMRRILAAQRQFYPDLLTEETCNEIFEAIYFQRPLKSCKHLVSICEFESREIKVNNNGVERTIVVGPRVAPVSSPLAQLCRIWESVNNIRLTNPRNKRRKHSDTNSLLDKDRLQSEVFELAASERTHLVQYLMTHEKLTEAYTLKYLGLKKTDGFAADKSLTKGIKGNPTYSLLKEALGDIYDTDNLLKFEPEIIPDGWSDKETGQLYPRVSDSYLKEPLYRLWHTVYSISDRDELAKALEKKFGITDKDTVDRIFNIDFRGLGFTNKSAKFMCKLLPLLAEGMMYSEACDFVGVNHSGSLTKAENESRDISDTIKQLKKGELRQPIVEKILNHLGAQVNAIIARYGHFDEVRIEMARTLKQNKEQRRKESLRINQREKENKQIADKLRNELHMRPTHNLIQRYRLWKEAEYRCMYCGKTISSTEFCNTNEVEREHVIPRSIFFDDSYSNKVCSCRDCNNTKGQMTGYDFMESRGDAMLQQYLDRVERLYKEKTISKTKHDRLLTPRTEIPTDFINRDLRQTQYITRKACELLRQVCRNVYMTSGSITDFLRHTWGYDTVLHNLNISRYEEAGQTEIIEREHKGHIIKEKRIIGWSKRLDHRHHAIDALVTALTRQSVVQRLNNLNQLYDIADITSADGQSPETVMNLEKWARTLPHISYEDTSQAISNIAVSFKSGKKDATRSFRNIRRGNKTVAKIRGILVPRGPLTNGTVYGFIRSTEEVDLNGLFSNPKYICSPFIRNKVENRLAEFEGNTRKSLASCKKKPILYTDGTPILKAHINVRKSVVKYKVEGLTANKLDSIVDKAVRRAVEERMRECNFNDAKFAKSLSERPLYRDDTMTTPIRTVRCFAGEKEESMGIVRRDSNGRPIGYSLFANNHHVALYTNADGQLVERIVPFAMAVRRRNLGLQVIVKDPAAVWQQLEVSEKDFDENFISGFPTPDLVFKTSLQLNDMFLIGLSDEEIDDLVISRDKTRLFNHLYRVQKLSSFDYNFKRHTSTQSDVTKEQMDNGNYIRITSAKRLIDLNVRKVKIDRLGNLSLITE